VVLDARGWIVVHSGAGYGWRDEEQARPEEIDVGTGTVDAQHLGDHLRQR
jgi:hypothetical protein